ncbi:hypothetical protein [Lysobacter fragariae]
MLAGAAAASPPQAAYVNVEQRLSTQQLHDTGLDTLSPAQLALLNQLLREEATQAAATVERATLERSQDAFAGAMEGPVESRLVGELSGWAPGTVFELENGQQWRVLKGEIRLPRTLQSPDIVVVPGVMGRWFFQVDEDTQKARVQRIR